MPEVGGAAERDSKTPAEASQGIQSNVRRALVDCDQWLGSDGYGGMKALRRAGWNVLVTPEWEYVPVKWRGLPMRLVGRALRPWAAGEFNADLLRIAETFRPEFLLVFKGRFVWATTLRRLREMGVKSYCFYPDVSFRAHGRYIPKALPEYDWIFTTKTFGIDDMRSQLGVTRSSVLNFGYDPDLHRPISLSDQDIQRFGCEVSYIGTWSPKKERLLGELARRRPDLRLRVWGNQWERCRAPALSAAVMGRAVDGEDFVRAVCATDINLSILSERRVGSSRGDQVATRTFSVPACGAFVLHERTDEVTKLFQEDEEIACFDEIDELVAKLDVFLADSQRRQLIAARGREIVQAHHSWDQRIRSILDRHAHVTHER